MVLLNAILPRLQAPSRRDRIPQLDGLRGIAIGSVLVYHYLIVISRIPRLAGVVRAGSLAWSGVDLFFVLSGFLIGGILIDAKGSPSFFRTFYIRRFYRILPLYFLLLILFWIARASLTSFPTRAWLFDGSYPWYAYLTFTQNFFAAKGGPGAHFIDVTWSLAVEEQFYLTVPLLIYFVPARYLMRVVVALLVVVFFARIVIYESFGWVASYVLTPARADALLLGIIGAILVRNEASVAWLESRATFLRAALGVAAAGIIAMLFLRIDISSPEMAYGGFTWLAASYLALLLYVVVVAPKGFVAGLTRFRPLRALGVVAYFVYMFHECVLGMVFGAIGHRNPGIRTAEDALLVLLSLAVTFSLAALSWRYFEKPLIRRGHRATYGLKEELAPAVGLEPTTRGLTVRCSTD